LDTVPPKLTNQRQRLCRREVDDMDVHAILARQPAEQLDRRHLR
jgi:hypothetical protein